MLPVANPSAVPCKVCGAAAPLFGVVDFHKSCLQQKGKFLPLSGIPIYYRRCPQCGLIFTDAFDDWSAEAFARRLYNRDYTVVDPDHVEHRPQQMARMLLETFGGRLSGLRILDFGGGTGKLAEILRGAGLDAECFDPFLSQNARPTGPYKLITSIEVLEHALDPARMMAEMASHLAEDGAMFLSTLTYNKEVARQGLNWWYVAPRNGHITIYSPRALSLLCRKSGLQMASPSEGIHLAFRTVTPLIAHLVKTASAAQDGAA